MKANELMLGDLVLLFGETPARVDAIGDIEVYVYEEKRGEDWHVGCEHIKPIPITPEILEKNGFAPVGDGIMQEKVQRFYVWYDTGKNELGIEIGENTYEEEIGTRIILNININSVHDLQHALRLCGIEKEIEL